MSVRSYWGFLPVFLAALLATAASSTDGDASPSMAQSAPRALPGAPRGRAFDLPLLPEDLQARLRGSAADPRLKPWQRDIMKQLGRPRGIGTPAASGTRLAASAPGDPGGTWTDVNLGSTYYNRYAHAAVYDPVRSRMLVFGGYNGSQALDEVWALSLSGSPSWTLLNPGGPSPGPRFLHSAVYDPVRDRVIVFGGIDNNNAYASGVWALSLSGAPSWSELSPTGIAPSGRVYHTAIYDPIRDRMLMFGGLSGSTGHAVDDLWALSLAGVPAWTKLTPTGTPGRRYGQAAIYDPVRDEMVVFGGFTEPSNTYVNDVWSLSLGTLTWTGVTTSGSAPAAGFAASAIYDPVADRVVVFGGIDGVSFTVSADACALTIASSSWAPIAPSGAPPSPRYLHTAIYDAGAGRMVIFGGVLDGVASLRDAEALSLSGGPSWSGLPQLGGTGPGGRGDRPVAIYDPVRDRIVTFGGAPGPSGTSDVWALSLPGAPTWTELTPAGAPPAGRSFSTGIYDPIRDRLVVFGGLTSEATNEVWELTMSGTPTWTELTPSGAPPNPRYGHTAIYDPVRDRMVVFGGYDGSMPFGDVWALSLSGTPAWTELSPSGAPPDPRYFHTAIYDPVRDRMLVAHGNTALGNPDDVWALSLATPAWNELAPAGSLPGGRYLATTIYDSVRDRMVLYAGYDPSSGPVNSSWELTLWGSPTWNQLVTLGATPQSKYGHAAIYDPVRDRMATFGASFYYTDDVRALAFPPSYTLVVSTTGSGSVTKSPDQPSYDAGTTVQLTATAGNAHHLATWTGDASGTANPLGVVMDGNKSITATFAQNPPLTASASATAILCNGGSSTVTVSASGGTAPYTGSGTFTVGAGTYSYTVTDAGSSTASTTISITQPTALTAGSVTGSIACNSGTTTVTVSASGGTGSYAGTGTYSHAAGTYSHTVTDANGCTATTTGDITQPAVLTATSSATPILANGGNSTVTVSATGGTAPYTGIGTFIQAAGTYSFTVTDANGCAATTTGDITQPSALTASSSATAVVCNGGSSTVTVTASATRPAPTVSR